MDLKIALEGIELASFELKPKLKDINVEKFFIDINAQVTATPIPKPLALTVTNVVVREFEGTIEHAKLSVIIAFRVENFDEAFPVVDGNHTIPPGVNAFLTSLSISTARGILFAELRGTYLNRAIIPIIDMNTLITTHADQSGEISQNVVL